MNRTRFICIIYQTLLVFRSDNGENLTKEELKSDPQERKNRFQQKYSINYEYYPDLQLKIGSRLLKILCKSSRCGSSTSHAGPANEKRGDEGMGFSASEGTFPIYIYFLISRSLYQGGGRWLYICSARTETCSHAENRFCS